MAKTEVKSKNPKTSNRKTLEIKQFDSPLSDLTPTSNNPRQISKKDFEILKKSMIEFPEMRQIREVVVDENMRILGGHQRVKVLESLGEKSVPVKQVVGLTEEQKKEFIIKDNVANGEWDLDILANEWDKEELTKWGLEFDDWVEEAPEIIEDEVPDIPKEAKSKLGEIYQLGEHILMCGDSTKKEDVDTLMGGVMANLLFTDPPYNVNIQNSKGMTIQNDNMASSEFRLFLDKAFKNASNNLKPGGAFYIWHADGESVNFRESALENGLETRQCLIWVKNSFNFGRQDYKWQHEPCLYGWKDGDSHYFVEEYNHPTVIEDKVDLDKLSKADMKKLLEEIFSDNIKKTIIHEDRPLKNDLHPTMKPLKMCAEMIRNSTRENEIVLDLFGGSGSTLMVCEQINRKCFMMEYDPLYADVIIERWEKFTGNKAKLISKGEKNDRKS